MRFLFRGLPGWSNIRTKVKLLKRIVFVAVFRVRAMVRVDAPCSCGRVALHSRLLEAIRSILTVVVMCAEVRIIRMINKVSLIGCSWTLIRTLILQTLADSDEASSEFVNGMHSAQTTSPSGRHCQQV